MIENYLINIGMRCGTLKNFNASVLEDARVNDYQHWYFLTPIKSTEKIGRIKEAQINLAFPFIAERDDIKESEVIGRLESESKCLQDELVSELRKRIIVTSQSFSIIPFWANEKTSERMDRRDFANIRLHILNAQLTVQYREHWF